MDRKEFGQLIAALRKEHFDEEGNRLTQAKLAERAQQLDPQSPLNEIIIGKIERGHCGCARRRANCDNSQRLDENGGTASPPRRCHHDYILERTNHEA